MGTRKRKPAGSSGASRDPFSEARLSEVFKHHGNSWRRLVTRESGTIEFKRNFQRPLLPRYAKTMSAFANAHGGYLVFGVGNNPRVVEGMSNNQFENFDPETLTSLLNTNFAPEIPWQMRTHEIRSLNVGLIYVAPCRDKPVIATSNVSDVIKDGDIYYRYRGRSERIRFPELRKILEDSRRSEEQTWLRHFKSIARAGPENAAVFDVNSGTVTGRAGTFIIDRDLLPKVRFIREGQFQERTGAPAIRLVGEAQMIAAGVPVAGKVAIQPTVIRGPQIFDVFLRQAAIATPVDFIRALCFEQSAYLPIYYFISQAQMTIDQALQVIDEAECSARTKSPLAKRLQGGDDKLKLVIPATQGVASKQRRRHVDAFNNRRAELDLTSRDARYLFQAIRSGEVEGSVADYVLTVLKSYDAKIWNADEYMRSEYRKAVCYVDWDMFMRQSN